MDAFEVFADDTRAAILRTLAERQRDAPEDPTLPFAELRRRAGVRDSGNFNYHLNRLRDVYVRKDDDGYRITNAGLIAVGSLLRGTYDESDRHDPTPLDIDCPECGEPLSAAYEDASLALSCPNDHEYRNALPPGALDDRSVAEAAALLSTVTRRDVALARDGACPVCFGVVEWSPRSGPVIEHALQSICRRCGARMVVPAGMLVADHPAVVSLYHDHGVDLRDRPLWSLPFCTDDAVERVAAEPAEYRVTVCVDGETVSLTLDATPAVTAVDAD